MAISQSGSHDSQLLSESLEAFLCVALLEAGYGEEINADPVTDDGEILPFACRGNIVTL